jgi:hypothetical protein
MLVFVTAKEMNRPRCLWKVGLGNPTARTIGVGRGDLDVDPAQRAQRRSNRPNGRTWPAVSRRDGGYYV